MNASVSFFICITVLITFTYVQLYILLYYFSYASSLIEVLAASQVVTNSLLIRK